MPLYGTLSSYSFDGPEYDFAANVGDLSVDELDVATTIEWAQWTKDHGLYANNILFPRGWSYDRIDRAIISPLRQLGLADQISVKMPHDEAVTGPLADQNIAFAKEFRTHFPDIRIYHPIGAMSGVRNPWDQRLAQLERYNEWVDIWGMRPVIVDTYWDAFFKKVMDEGDVLAPYIHFCDQVESPQVLILSRSFFYRLMQMDIKAITYWAVNMWYQPIKALGHGSRAERKLWEVPNGYRTLLRNWTGITAGMIFYPLPGGPAPSLIALTWRDGLEDVEYFELLKKKLAEVEGRGLRGGAADEAHQMLGRVRSTVFVEDRWTAVPTADSGQMFWLRDQMAAIIAGLDAMLR